MIYRITVYRIKKEKILNKWTTWEQCSEHSVQCSIFVQNNLNKSWTHEQKLNNIEISVFMFMCSEHAQKKRVHVHVFRGSKMRCSLFICSFCSTFVQCSEHWTSPVPSVWSDIKTGFWGISGKLSDHRYFLTGEDFMVKFGLYVVGLVW